MSGSRRIVKWRSRVPWVEKLRPDLKPKVVTNPWGPGRMLVPTPLLIAAELRKVRRGHLITVARLRDRLARNAGAEATCPLTTGIVLHIVAGATEERLTAGGRPTAPYWRVVGPKGELNPKWPPGAGRQARHLRSEGHRIVRRGGTWCVEGYELRGRSPSRRRSAGRTTRE
jgi:hypothetical protein